MPLPTARDERYAGVFLAAIGTCRNYRPRFGAGRGPGLTLEEFQSLYHADPFYSWLGLDSPLMYSAHKAAGGMTSVYRQIGYGCQLIFTQILVDELGLTEEDATWSYEVKRPSGKIGKLSLDGRIPINRVENEEKRDRVLAWMNDCSARVGITSAIAQALKGVVFEVRQGYKSKDSKRQNADIANAATALAQGYLPVVLLLSSQIDKDLLDRYAGANWLILRGTTEGTPLDSTYLFVREIIGYDLARFFENYSERFRAEIEDVVRTLLTP